MESTFAVYLVAAIVITLIIIGFIIINFAEKYLKRFRSRDAEDSSMGKHTTSGCSCDLPPSYSDLFGDDVAETEYIHFDTVMRESANAIEENSTTRSTCNCTLSYLQLNEEN